jgi:hypothetical protein
LRERDSKIMSKFFISYFISLYIVTLNNKIYKRSNFIDYTRVTILSIMNSTSIFPFWPFLLKDHFSNSQKLS